jgi:xylulokinase
MTARGADPLLLGMDAGTTNIKAVIAAPDGTVVAQASEPSPVTYPRPEWAEYEPEALWRGCLAAVRAAVARLDDPARVRGLAIASMAETAVPLDAESRPTFPAIAWFDKRARPQLEALVRTIGAERLFAVSGLAAEPIFGLLKLLWLKDERPEAFAATRRWLNVADYLAWRFCGEQATDHSLACRTYAYDLASLCWADGLMREVGVEPGLMAPLARSGAALGRLTPEAATATGLAPDCMVAVGGHDHVVGAFAADALRPGVLLNSLGTTEALLLQVNRPVMDLELARRGLSQGVIVVDRPCWYVVGGLFTAGGAVEWFRRAMAAGAPYETLLAEAEAAPVGSLGTGFLPHLRLGTPPHPDPHARGAFFGLSTDTTRGCLFRALLEGVAADARLCADAMETLVGGAAAGAVRVIGGGSRNDLYLRIKAATWNRPLAVLDMPEAVALGAACLAGIGAGVYRGQDDVAAHLRRAEHTVRPDPAWAALYGCVLEEVYRRASTTVRPLHEASRACLAGQG